MEFWKAPLDDLPPVLWFVGVSLVLLWVVTRPRLARQALHLVMSHPAYLVPAAMAVVGIGAVTLLSESSEFGAYAVVHESPFRSMHGQLSRGLGWAGLAVVSVAIAGLVGLLEAHAAGREPSSDAFRKGIRRHVASVFLAKLLVAALLAAILGWIRPDGRNAVLLVVCLVPSLILAPILGATALHPGRPGAAFKETFGIVQREMWSVGRLITAQAVFLVGLFVLWGRAVNPSLVIPMYDELFVWNPAALGHGASALSFNHFPFVLGTTDRLISGLAVLIAAFSSTVFIAAHHLGATRGYAAPAPVEIEVDDVETAA